jgi:hypothetical protein
MTPNTVFAPGTDAAEALSLAKGTYQYGLLSGNYRWSGADLAGKARKWSASYSKSRKTIVARLNNAGFKVVFGKAEHNRIFVTISR